MGDTATTPRAITNLPADQYVPRGPVTLHRALLEVLGDCPPRLLPVPETKREIPTLREFFVTWIERQKPPLYRPIRRAEPYVAGGRGRSAFVVSRS